MRPASPWHQNQRYHTEKKKKLQTDITIADKGLYGQSYGFSNSQLWIWKLDNKKSWAPKNWCFWTMLLEKILESNLDSKKIKPVNPKGN